MPAWPGRRGPKDGSSTLAAGLDGLLDGALVAFALWTLAYVVALVLQLSLWPVVWLWLPVAAAVVVVAVVWNVRTAGGAGTDAGRGFSEVEPGDPGASGDNERERRAGDPVRLGALLLLSVPIGLLVYLLGKQQSHFPVIWAVWALLVAVVAAALLTGRVGVPGGFPGRSFAGEPAELGRPFEHWIVVLLGIVAAGFSSLLLNTDADDVYYVNRSVWVAEHGVPALRDTIFGAERYPSAYGGGLPLPSVESLFGALAHAFGMSAGSMTYLVSVPLLSFGFVWATWRLVRVWAPRRHLLVLVGALAFVVLCAGTSAIGNYSFGRIWQGKVAAVCLLVPLIWCFATRLARRGSAYDQLMMVVLGTCFVGLTSTAAILVPLVGGALVVAALLLRSRPLALGGVLLSLAPILSGLAVVLFSTGVGGAAPESPSPWLAFSLVFGWDPAPAALVVVALVLAAVVVRPGPPAVLALAATALVVACLTPGFMALVNAATGSGPVVWRLLLAAPLAPMVGLLLAADWGFGRRWLDTGLTVAVSVVLVVVIAASGARLWSPSIGATMTSRPTWKVDQKAFADVRAITRLRVGEGPVLLPAADMTTLAVTTTKMFALVPRGIYAEALQEPAADHAARFRLYRLVTGSKPFPPAAQVRRDLDRLDVSLVCVKRQARTVVHLVRQAGYQPYRHVHRLICLEPATS